MALERASAGALGDLRKSYVTHNIKFKAEVLDRLAEDGSASKIAREFGLSESTVRSYRKCEDAIRKAVASVSVSNDRKSMRWMHHEQMEQELLDWIKENNTHGISSTGPMIQEKALQLYANLCEEDPNYRVVSGEFVASTGWLALFRQRYKHILKDTMGSVDVTEGPDATNCEEDCFSASVTSVEEFHSVLQKAIEEDGYRPEQVFNAAETRLYWKRMPEGTVITKEEVKTKAGYKASNDRISLVFCTNTTGDLRLKPLLVYRTENPVALRDTIKTCLPVVWHSNPTTCVTAALFEDWATSYAIHAITEYNRRMNLDNRALIIVDSTSSHPALLNHLHPTIKFLFVPPENTTLIQPLDLGAISQFKRLYTKAVMERLMLSIYAWKMHLLDAWKLFDIREAIGLIDRSWKDVKNDVINRGWQNLWPGVVSDTNGSLDVNQEVQMLLEIAKRVPGDGFETLTDREICKFLESGEEESLHEKYEVAGTAEDEEEPMDVEANSIHPLTADEIGEFLGKFRSILYLLERRDPDLERSSCVIRDLERGLNPYQQLYSQLLEEQHQQSTVKKFPPFPQHQDLQSLTSPSLVNFSYSSAFSDNDRLQWELRKYPCNLCTKKFKSKTTLDQHILVHNNERRFSCDQCGTRFNRKDHLQRHLLIHLREKKYSCENCKKKLPCKDHLLRQSFTHARKKKFSCRLCSRSFSRLKSLRLHMVRHNGEKAYGCTYCSATFNFKINLRQHMTSHAGEKHTARHLSGQHYLPTQEREGEFKQCEEESESDPCFENFSEHYEENYLLEGHQHFLCGEKKDYLCGNLEGMKQEQSKENRGHLKDVQHHDDSAVFQTNDAVIKEEIDSNDGSIDNPGSESPGYLPDHFFPVCDIVTTATSTEETHFVPTLARSVPAPVISVVPMRLLSSTSPSFPSLSTKSSISALETSPGPELISRPPTPVSPASSSGSVHLEDTTTRAGRVTRKPLRYRTNYTSHSIVTGANSD